jgi:hypothetical protein
MRENSAKLITENKKDLQYNSEITGPFQEDRSQPIGRRREKVEVSSRAGRGGKVEYQCPHCDLWGHQRRSSKDCLKNPKNNANSEGPSTIPTLLVPNIGDGESMNDEGRSTIPTVLVPKNGGKGVRSRRVTKSCRNFSLRQNVCGTYLRIFL